MKRMWVIAVIVSVRCLYAVVEFPVGCVRTFSMADAVSSDQSCIQKINGTDNLSALLYLKAVAEKNGYSKAIEQVDDKLSRFSDVEKLCQYISSYCDNSKDPATLNEVSYRRHNVEIVASLSLLRNLLPRIDQNTRIAATHYYNTICRTIKSWSCGHGH